MDSLKITLDKFTFEVANDRLYTPEGVWVKPEGQTIRIGISDFLQQSSGDVAFADVKPVDSTVSLGDEVAAIETIKVNLSLASPASGKILEVNPSLETSPEVINQDPYGEGWLALIEPSNWQSEQHRLLTAQAYFEKMKTDAAQELR